MNRFDSGSNSFYVGNSKVSYTVDSGRTSRSSSKELTSSQIIVIAKALKQIDLDPRKDHRIKVAILSSDEFRVVVDNSKVIKIEKDSFNNIEVIKEKAVKSIFSSVKQIFRFVTNLIYRPSFAHAGLKERSYDQAVRDDYRSLRKGLKAGQAWMSGREGGTEVAAQLKTTIASGKRIEGALHSRSPERAMKKVAAGFADEIHNKLEVGQQLTIPTAYLTSTGVLQPVMLQFKMDKGGQLSLEIFADHMEAGSRIQPTQIRVFDPAPSLSEIESILSIFLQPLLMKGDQKALHSLAKSSETFAALYEEQRALQLNKLAPNMAESSASIEVEDKQSSTLNYAALIASVDAQVGNGWSSKASSDKLVAPSTTPADRVAKWLNHLTGRSLSEEEKNHLILSLTELWVGDVIKQIDSKTPLVRQLEVYQDCLEQINHVAEKVAHRAGGILLSDELARLKGASEAKIAEIQPRLRRQQIEASQEFLAEPHSSTLNIPAAARPAPPMPVAQPVNPVDTQSMNQARHNLAQLLSPQKLEAFQNNCAASLLDREKPEDTKGAIFAMLNGNKDELRALYAQAMADPNAQIEGQLEKLAAFLADPQRLDLNPEENFGVWLDVMHQLFDPRHPAPTSEEKQALIQQKDLITGNKWAEEKARMELSAKIAAGDVALIFKKALAMNRLKGVENIPSAEEAAKEVNELQTSLSSLLGEATMECEKLMQAAYGEPNVERKKRLLQEAQEQAVDVLRLLPSPGSEQAFGETSVWAQLPNPELAQNNLLSLQKVIWESQMRLGQTQLPAVARLQLIKAQAVQQSLFLQNSGLKASDAIIMDAQLANVFLSQDLTAQLSIDPHGEKDLVSLYRFVASLLPATDAGYQHRSLEKKSADPDVRKQAQGLLQADLMYQMSVDPEFTLYPEAPTVGVSFFAACPSALLAEKEPLTIVAGWGGDSNSPDKNGAIQSSNGRILANIYCHGHPDFADNEMRICKAKPFLPTVFAEVEDRRLPEPLILDDRICRTFGEWMEYISEKSRSTALAIPPSALIKLFEIRQAPTDGLNGKSATSYESSTAVRALAFLADPANTKYLEQEFVQRYLNESLFGAFLMQQALMEYPELMLGLLDGLQARIEASADRPEVQGYLLGVAAQLYAHTQVREASWEQQGMTSGMIDGAMPVHIGKRKGGILERIEENFARKENIENKEQIKEPVAYRMKFVTNCKEKLAEILEGHEDNKLRLRLFEGKKGERLLDKLNTAEGREHIFQLLISEYQRDLADGSLPVLEAEDFTALFLACQGIDHPDVQFWFHRAVLPLFSSLDDAAKQQVLTAFANEITKPPLAHGRWVQDENNPLLFRFAGDTQSFEIDLYHLARDSGKASKAERVPIPHALLMRDDIQKALKTDRVMVQALKEKNQVTYVWSHQGQQFSLKALSSGQTVLTRTINGVEYRYQAAPTSSEDSAAEALVAKHGIWVSDKGTRIFTQGMQMPSRLDSYAVQRSGDRFVNVQSVESQGKEGHYVSCNPRIGHPSPLLFAQSDRVVTLLRGDQVAELRVEGSDLHFVREKDRWICMKGGQSLGPVVSPADEQPLIDAFGEHWTQFVIPLKKPDGTMGIVLIPYVQSVSRHGVMSVDQDKLPASIEMMSVSAEGHMKGSASAHLYLAHSKLLEASKAVTPTAARAHRLQAQRHLEAVAALRPASDAESLQSLQRTMEMVRNRPVVAVKPTPSPESLASALRMGLEIRRLRNIAKVPLTPKENFAEIEHLTSLYRAYNALEASKAFSGKGGKEALLLSQHEKNQLVQLHESLFISVGEDQGLAQYFGGQIGSLETSSEIARPTKVEPQFILALLRHAKPVQVPPIDPSQVTAPLPVNVLVENFWNYFSAIKNNHLTPDQVRFLFSPSVIPPTHNLEEAKQWAAIDRQARQFLLAAADLEGTFGGEVNPKAELDKAFIEIREKIDEFANENKVEFFQNVSANIGNQFNGLKSALSTLEAKAAPKEVAGRTVQFVDVEHLGKQLSNIDVLLDNFTGSLAKIIADSDQLVHKTEEKYKGMKNEVDRWKESIRNKESLLKDAREEEKAALERSLNEAKTELEEKIEELEKFMQEEIKLPFGDSYDNEMILRDPYFQGFISELKQVSAQCSTLQRQISVARKDAEQIAKLFEAWTVLEEAAAQVTNLQFKTQPGLDFPEKGPVAEKLKEMITPAADGNLPPMTSRSAIDLMRAAGLVKGTKLALNLAESLRTGLPDKLSSFAPVLEILAKIPQATGKIDPITIGQTHLPAEQSLPIELSNKARKFLSEAQYDKIKTDLAKLNAPGRKAYIQRLSEVLKEHEDLIASQSALEDKLTYIEKTASDLALRPVIERLVVAPPMLAEDKFDENYSTHFSRTIRINSEAFSESNWQEINDLMQKIRLDADWRAGISIELLQKPEFAAVSQVLEQLERGLALNDTNALAMKLLNDFTAVAKSQNWVTPGPKGWSQLASLMTQNFSSLAQRVHQAEDGQLLQDLEHIIADDDASVQAKDFRTGVKNLQAAPPLAYKPSVKAESLSQVRSRVNQDISQIIGSIKMQEDRIAEALSKAPIASLPSELQRVRLRKGSERELLETAYKIHRRGGFDPRTYPDKTLDGFISECLVDATRLKALNSGKTNALDTLKTLDVLEAEKQELFTQLKQVQTLHEHAQIAQQLAGIEAKWVRESSKLQDCLQRCQNTQHLNNLPSALKAHTREIIYLQYRLGVVLRQDQIQALEELTQNPSILVQMRMGLGKTSVLVPFALEILASEGYNAIGMVPKAQFYSNFDEMDETMRLVFELSGEQLLFSREDAPIPLTKASLHLLSEKCADILKALANGQYVLTTIESKASLDNKIVELEEYHAEKQKELNKIKPDAPQWASLYQQMMDVQTALDMLYRVKHTFELPNTRIPIDEADSVARASYSVNAEVGKKVPPAPVICETVADVFEIIRTGAGEIARLRDDIFQNNQFTLTQEEVDNYLKAIGKAWLDKKNDPQLKEKEEAILNWLAGGPSPFTVQESLSLGPVKNELNVLRKTLNHGLRSSLSLRIGLSTTYDPIRQAVGVPAQQGLTSATTKFSDSIMQLCLTNMIAMYSPQGEEFLLSNVGNVLEKLVQNANKSEQVEEAAKELNALIGRHRNEPGLKFSEELAGSDPWKVLLRSEFAKQAAAQQLIYLSYRQISRPVQNTVRSCNVIGTTGTATRNLTQVIGSNGNPNGMAGVEAAGRTTTAEVIYRIAKSSPKGLETEVKTFPTQNEAAFEQLQSLAQKGSGYNFLINQAGLCDHKTQREIVEALHSAGDRPIVFLDILTNKKCAIIDKRTIPLDQLTPEEKARVCKEGFYYYPAAHARGTHFDIPTGSKGALMLSPTVNTNDRDQAAYRARELGEGHTLDCFISEKQQTQIQAQTNKAATLRDVLKINFQQTKQEEGTEDLAAYRLHLQGQLNLAADKAKKRLQLEKPVAHIGEYARKEEGERQVFAEHSQHKAELFQILKEFYLTDTSNEAYLEQLEQEMYKGGSEPTQSNLLRTVNIQLTKITQIQTRLEKNKEKLGPGYAIAQEELSKARTILEVEQKKIMEEWESMSSLFPSEVAASTSMQDTCEVEAEQEAQQEQQVQVESLAERERQARAFSTKELLTTPDNELLSRIDYDPQFAGYQTSAAYGRSFWVNAFHYIPPARDENRIAHHHGIGNLYIATSKALDKRLEYTPAGSFPDMAMLVVNQPTDNGVVQRVWLVDPTEGYMASNSMGVFQHQGQLLNGAIIRPELNEAGELQFAYQASGHGMKGLSNELQGESLQAQLLIGLLHIGASQLNEEQWSLLSRHCVGLTPDENEQLKNSLQERLGVKNPKLFAIIGQHLWNH